MLKESTICSEDMYCKLHEYSSTLRKSFWWRKESTDTDTHRFNSLQLTRNLNIDRFSMMKLDSCVACDICYAMTTLRKITFTLYYFDAPGWTPKIKNKHTTKNFEQSLAILDSSMDVIWKLWYELLGMDRNQLKQNAINMMVKSNEEFSCSLQWYFHKTEYNSCMHLMHCSYPPWSR